MSIINTQEDDVELEHQQATIPQARSSLLYEAVALTILNLGVADFFHSGHTTLIYIVCLMAAAYAGQPIAKNVIPFLKGDAFAKAAEETIMARNPFCTHMSASASLEHSCVFDPPCEPSCSSDDVPQGHWYYLALVLDNSSAILTPVIPFLKSFHLREDILLEASSSQEVKEHHKWKREHKAKV